MKKIVIAALLVAAPAVPLASQVRPIEVFRCNLGTKIAEVVAANGTITYRYGKPGEVPDIEIRTNGKDGNAFGWTAVSNHHLFKQLRFVNKDFSYIVHQSDDNDFGLAVLHGTTDVSDRHCIKGAKGFPDEFDIEAFPTDDDAHGGIR